MKPFLDENIAAVLQCPHCRNELESTPQGGYICPHEDLHFGFTDSGSLDLRPKRPVPVELKFSIPPAYDLTRVPRTTYLPMNPQADASLQEHPAPKHLSRELISYFPRASGRESLVLDLGCGEAIHRQVCEKSGFTYVGIDQHNPGALILADAHVLPFKDESFEFTLSVAVLEHIQFPMVMIREANRVMKPGGVLIGTVAFLEPFHEDSFYHHSRLGLLNTLSYGGFEIRVVSPGIQWSVFRAQAKNAAGVFFPRMPAGVSRNIILFPDRLSKLFWKLPGFRKPGGLVNPDTDRVTGAFSFVAKKPAA